MKCAVLRMLAILMAGSVTAVFGPLQAAEDLTASASPTAEQLEFFETKIAATKVACARARAEMAWPARGD